jgi:hypothetical protein
VRSVCATAQENFQTIGAPHQSRYPCIQRLRGVGFKQGNSRCRPAVLSARTSRQRKGRSAFEHSRRGIPAAPFSEGSLHPLPWAKSNSGHAFAMQPSQFAPVRVSPVKRVSKHERAAPGATLRCFARFHFPIFCRHHSGRPSELAERSADRQSSALASPSLFALDSTPTMPAGNAFAFQLSRH